MRFFNGPIKRSVGGAEPRAEVFVAFPVETTNEVSRVVIAVDETPRTQSRIEKAMSVLSAWIRMRPNVPATRGYSITNETAIKPAA